jgi:acid phosphatase
MQANTTKSHEVEVTERHRRPGRLRRLPTVSGLLSALLMAGLLVVSGQHRPAKAAAAEAPIRAAFYYGWFPETEHWSSHYVPAAGKYDSSDPAVVSNQVRQAKAAGLNAFISSWWGQGTKTDSRLPLLLDTANAQGFKVAPYYEKEGFGNPTAAELTSDLGYLAAKAAATPAWLRVGGRPVLFVYNADDTSCAVTDRWISANQGRFYLNMKVLPGYQTCAQQPDAWHQYGPASAIQEVLPWSVNVAPGFFKFDESSPRLARDMATFKSVLAQQVKSGAQWQLVTSWNEWGEGTGVEPTTQYAQTYTDAMASAYAPVSAPLPGAQATAVAAADSYVASNAAGTNYGTAATVQQNAASTATAVSYLRFPAPAGPVAKATLRLFSRSSGVTPSKVFSTSASWDEQTLTWANRPALGAQAGTTGTLTAGQWTQADVTAAVQAGATSFGLTTAATATRYFDSREAANAPQLVIEYSTTSSAPASSSAPATSAPATSAPATSAPATSSAPTTSAPAPTSSAPAPAGVTKLLTVVVENHSLGQVSAGMPYVDGMAKRFAYASNYTAIRHPSLPNYLAMTGGDTFGVTDDAAPSSHPLAGDSVFDQAIARGKTAATYAETMTSNCQLTSSGTYAVKHNPWAYFSGTTQRANCKRYNLPAGTPASGAMHSAVAAGTLPNAGYWIPNLCDDAHDCSLTTADNYIKSWLPQIMAGPDYTSGRLAIVITADEDDSHSGNVVLTAVIHRSLDGSHKVVTSALNHYSLLRTYDRVLGASLLRKASTATDLAAAFALPVG